MTLSGGLPWGVLVPLVFFFENEMVPLVLISPSECIDIATDTIPVIRVYIHRVIPCVAGPSVFVDASRARES